MSYLVAIKRNKLYCLKPRKATGKKNFKQFELVIENSGKSAQFRPWVLKHTCFLYDTAGFTAKT